MQYRLLIKVAEIEEGLVRAEGNRKVFERAATATRDRVDDYKALIIIATQMQRGAQKSVVPSKFLIVNISTARRASGRSKRIGARIKVAAAAVMAASYF